MSTNQYFKTFRVRSEQNLYDDLTQEVIQIMGIDMLYLPREFIKLDSIFGEDVLSAFTDYYDIEIMIKERETFGGQGDIFQKFGANIAINDQTTVMISRTRWDEATNTELKRPREGDLIFDPLTKSLFEIKFVEDEVPFFQLGDLPVWELTIEKYVYSSEELETGITEIDQIEEDKSYQYVLSLRPDGLGRFIEGETVFQGPDLDNAIAVAEVAWQTEAGDKLYIYDLSGDFDKKAGPIYGCDSNATFQILSVPGIDDYRHPDAIRDDEIMTEDAKPLIDDSEGRDVLGVLKELLK